MPETHMPPSFSERDEDRHRTLEEAFRAYADDLYRYIYSKVGQAALAEDVTSAVFLKAIRWLQQGRTIESIRLLEGEGIAAGLLGAMEVRLDVVRAAIEHPDEPISNVYVCSFCRRTSKQVPRIFRSMVSLPLRSSPSPELAFICSECVKQFHTLLLEPETGDAGQ